MLEKEIIRNKGEENGKRQLQERIVDLEEELKKSIDLNNILNDKLTLQEDQLNDAKSKSTANEAKLSEYWKKVR
jgi:predicted  nucleic acid-binding Zn-ribbon protein